MPDRQPGAAVGQEVAASLRESCAAGSGEPYAVCTIYAYNRDVGFEWDVQNKAGINFRRHGVRLPEAIPVFGHP